MTLNDLFEFYRTTFLPAYSDVVGFTAIKPTQFLIEIENTFAHVAQYHNPALSIDIKNENLRKAKDHLTRVTLDCYKLLWVQMDGELNKFYLDDKKRAFTLNISEEEFLKGYNSFKEKAQHARIVELSTIGANPLIALEEYKEAIVVGKGLIKTIDKTKILKLNKYENIFSMKNDSKGFCMGIVTGLIATAFWNFNDTITSIQTNFSVIWNYIITLF